MLVVEYQVHEMLIRIEKLSDSKKEREVLTRIDSKRMVDGHEASEKRSCEADLDSVIAIEKSV